MERRLFKPYFSDWIARQYLAGWWLLALLVAAALLLILLVACGEPESEVHKQMRLSAPPDAGWTGCDMDWRRCQPGQRRAGER